MTVVALCLVVAGFWALGVVLGMYLSRKTWEPVAEAWRREARAVGDIAERELSLPIPGWEDFPGREDIWERDL